MAQPHPTTALEEVLRGRPTAVAHVVDGPDELLGRTLCVLGVGAAAHGKLDDGEVDRAVAAQAGARGHLPRNAVRPRPCPRVPAAHAGSTRIHFENLNLTGEYGPVTAYGQSKPASLLPVIPASPAAQG